MSKKRFSEGLEGLFNEAADASGSSSAVLERHEAPSGRKAAHKNFMSDLDALLQEALDDSLERYESAHSDFSNAGGKSKTAIRNSPLPRYGGLDALIRQTVDMQEMTTDEATGKKRLTVSVDKTKLEKLKAIARLENSYLKDLLSHVIDGYIVEYTQQKGIDL
jgi:hypothetical protein